MHMRRRTVCQEAVHACMAWAAEYHGIRLKEERNMPEMLKYLGWCSWDAFYTEISEEKVLRKGQRICGKKCTGALDADG